MAAAPGDLAFWAALPASARRRIVHALRQEEEEASPSKPEASSSKKPREEEGAEGAGGGDDDGKGIDGAATKKPDEKAKTQPPFSSFRAPPRRGVSVAHALVPALMAEKAACELDELLEERGRPGGVAGGGGGSVRSDTACWLGDEGNEGSFVAPLPPALASVRSVLLSLRSSLAGEWDVGGTASVQAARYLAGGRYARHSDEKEEEDEGDEEKEGLRNSPNQARQRRRTITAICYLDDAGRKEEEGEEIDGKEGGEGGELVIYPWSSSSSSSPSSSSSSSFPLPLSLSLPEPRVVIPPSPGLCVCFDSTLQHEVLPLVRARGPRRAVTVFFSSSDSPSSSSTLPPATAAKAALSSVPASETARRRLRITRPGHIFVSVPSFRDPETRWTLHSLFDAADEPDKVSAGVVWQVSPGGSEKEDDGEDLLRPVGAAAGSPAEQLALYHSRVRSARLPAADASGPCAARAIAASLWQGEDFYLSVDAHSRFARGWDTKLKKTLAEAERLEEESAAAREAGSSSSVPFHPLLTAYPPSYEGEGPAARIPFDFEEAGNGAAAARPFATLLCASHFGAEGVLRLVGKKWRRRRKEGEKSPFAPIRSLFWAAGFSFSRAHFAVCTPTRYESSGSDLWTKSLFFGEEHDVAARALSAGYRFWAPPPAAVSVFTRYERSQVRGTPPMGARGSPEAVVAARRLVAAFGSDVGKSCDDDSFFVARSEIEARYGPNVAGLWKGIGVDWRLREIDRRARRGGVGEGDEEVEFCDGGGGFFVNFK